jgi:hypothetical protein
VFTGMKFLGGMALEAAKGRVTGGVAGYGGVGGMPEGRAGGYGHARSSSHADEVRIRSGSPGRYVSRSAPDSDGGMASGQDATPPARSSSRTPFTPTKETDEATLAVPKMRVARSRSRSKTPRPPSQPKQVEYHASEAAVDEEVEAEAEPVGEKEEAGEQETKPFKKATRARGGASNKTKPIAVPTPAVAAPSRARSHSRFPAPAPAVNDEPETSLEPEPRVTKTLKPKTTRGRANKPTSAPSDLEELRSMEVPVPQILRPSSPLRVRARISSWTRMSWVLKMRKFGMGGIGRINLQLRRRNNSMISRLWGTRLRRRN